VSKIIDRELIRLKRRLRFLVEIKDRVGQLSGIINEIVSMGGNVVKLRQDTNWNKKGLDYVNVMFEIELQTVEQSKELIDNLKEKGYKLEILS
ncbi:threonine ammonia-lyase, partial [Coprococcus sp. MSK.21.13]|nr:threonine ammonia-lyase [Coprococcus sp. MSK.21.13]